MKKKVESPTQARRFIDALEIVPQPSALAIESVAPPQPDYKAGAVQAVAVGSQIAEFAATVPQELRPHIANSFLLAQLAANKAVGSGGTLRVWFDTYTDVLANIGWIVESESMTAREVSGSGAEVHKAIIPVITALAATAAAAPAIVAVLKGLADMNKNQPWITLFDRESQRGTAGQFQVSYAAMPATGQPTIGVAAFELDASSSVTQVLFFKFTKSSAKLRHLDSMLSMNEAVFTETKAAVQARVAAYTKSYVAAIEI